MEKRCDVCGERFETRTRSPDRERFCGNRCYRKFWNARDAEKRKRAQPLARPCVVCSRVFTPDVHHPRAATCSVACSQRRAMERRADERASARDVSPRACALCATQFAPGILNPKQKYCSPRCTARAASRAYYVREGAESQTKRARKYRAGRNWQQAMERAGFKCEICAATRRLHVHHRDGTGEDAKGNHGLGNLVVLCNSCHSKIHRIKYRIIGGQVYVFGLVFDWLGVESVRVLKNTS
jgi:hypothetical protein